MFNTSIYDYMFLSCSEIKDHYFLKPFYFFIQLKFIQYSQDYLTKNYQERIVLESCRYTYSIEFKILFSRISNSAICCFSDGIKYRILEYFILVACRNADCDVFPKCYSTKWFLDVHCIHNIYEAFQLKSKKYPTRSFGFFEKNLGSTNWQWHCWTYRFG